MRWMGTAGTVELYARTAGTLSSDVHGGVLRSAAADPHRGARRVTHASRAVLASHDLSLSLSLAPRPLVARPHRRPRSRAAPGWAPGDVYMSNWMLKRVAPTGRGTAPARPAVRRPHRSLRRLMRTPASPAASTRAAGAACEHPSRRCAGVRAGTIVFLGIAAGNVGNYLFHFVSARLLGPASYGDVASLVAVIGLISLPARRRSGRGGPLRRGVRGGGCGDARSRSALQRRGCGCRVVVGIVVSAVLVRACRSRCTSFLGIDSLAAVSSTGLVAAPSVVSPVVWGLAQGFQRFVLFAVSIGLGPAVRPVLAAVLLAAGFGVAGAMGATLIAAIVATAVPLVLLRGWLTRDTGRPEPGSGCARLRASSSRRWSGCSRSRRSRPSM